jgi:hypothetical protein
MGIRCQNRMGEPTSRHLLAMADCRFLVEAIAEKITAIVRLESCLPCLALKIMTVPGSLVAGAMVLDRAEDRKHV